MFFLRVVVNIWVVSVFLADVVQLFKFFFFLILFFIIWRFFSYIFRCMRNKDIFFRDIVNDLSFKAIVIDFFDFSSKFIFGAVCVGVIILLFFVFIIGLETDFTFNVG